MWQSNERYPDSSVRVLDASFAQYRLPLASVERLYTGCRWSEGPVYFGDGRYLLWSDIPNDRMLKWDETTGQVSVFRHTSHNANGNTRDRQGRLVTCEHRGRRVTRTEHDGVISVVMDQYGGKRLNSPNDVVTTRDGAIWFTDPTFGIRGKGFMNPHIRNVLVGHIVGPPLVRRLMDDEVVPLEAPSAA